MMTRDEWLRRDAVGDDGDLRLEVCPECRAGEHGLCVERNGGADASTAADRYPECFCDCGDAENE